MVGESQPKLKWFVWLARARGVAHVARLASSWAWLRFILRVWASICAFGVAKETEEKREERHFLRSITLIMFRRFLSPSNLKSLHTALSPSRPRFAAPLLTRHVTAQSGIRSIRLFSDCIARFYFSSIHFDFNCSYSNQELLPSERGSKMSCQLLPATSVRRFRPASRYLRFFPCNQRYQSNLFISRIWKKKGGLIVRILRDSFVEYPDFFFQL